MNCGMMEEDVLHAHGRLHDAVCAVCGIKYSTAEMFNGFQAGEVRWCHSCAKEGIKGPIKPNVVFFNESLPEEFHLKATKKALEPVDLLLIMGTTLKVKPFSLIPNRVPRDTP